MDRNDIQKGIKTRKTALGVEFGSTRIKVVLIGEDHLTIASGSYDWKTASGHTMLAFAPRYSWAHSAHTFLKRCPSGGRKLAKKKEKSS